MIPQPSVSAVAHTPKLEIRRLDAAGWLALGDEWETLVECALEENAYYARQYVRALLTHVETRKIEALSVWSGQRLVALLPFSTSRWHWMGIAKTHMAWKTPYSTLTIPLIDRDFAEMATAALVKAMRALNGAWVLPEFQLEGPVHALFVEEWNKQGMTTRVFAPFDRAIMKHEGDFEQHRRTVFSKKRRKELERVRKRLADLGDITEAHATEGAELDQAVEEFLRIEASGWKGHEGTALGSSEKTRAFAREAFGAHEKNSLARADLLLLNGTAIAAYLTLQTGSTGFTIKCAFDETFRSQGVGLILFENMIRNFLSGNWATKLDSAANEGHMIGALYNSTLAMGDLLVYGPEMFVPFAIIAGLEALRRRIRETAKSGWLGLQAILTKGRT